MIKIALFYNSKVHDKSEEQKTKDIVCSFIAFWILLVVAWLIKSLIF